MSHEIRTPLNAILGFVQLLQHHTKDEKTLKYLNIIRNSSNTLLSVINDILDFSKIESGKLTIEELPFNPHNEFLAIAQLFGISAKERSIELINTIDPMTPECLIGDIMRIKQIIYNFLSNALKFTPEHKRVYLDVHYDHNSSRLFASVSDEGIGISQEAQTKIFQAFEQADNSTTRK
ncbi:MAG: hypothetical protein IE916_05435 [Epsilonproteobacteria bacterium]|nr:hypothetical protein [Campylobacterota bacterium]